MKTINVNDFYRSLAPELKTFLSVANKEVGLGPTLELLAEKVGLPSKLTEGERTQLRQLAGARNVQMDTDWRAA